jgi:RsiW-degrading membrane proteinase PrsW (M82 family)
MIISEVVVKLYLILSAGAFLWFLAINTISGLDRKTLISSLIIAVCAGSATYHPAAWLNSLYLKSAGTDLNGVMGNFSAMVSYSAFVGINEELLKFLAAYLISTQIKDYCRPSQGYVYGASAALGFAVIENIYYMPGLNAPMLVMRLLVAAPLHIFLALLWSAGINRHRFQKANVLSSGAALVLAAAALHGIFNFQALASVTIGDSIKKTVIILFISAICSVYVMRRRNTA